MEMPPRHRRRRDQVVRSWIGQWLVYLALWFVLTGTLSLAELALGVFCAALAATAGEIVWAEPLARFTGDLHYVAQAWRLPKYAFTGTWEILVVLAKHLSGREQAHSLLRALQFDAGRVDDEHDATRRALAVTYTTMTPNFVIIGIDSERGLMLFHQLTPTHVLPITRKLGARP
jgi:multisubunit Na+/H+ antiporter MnhE subunit